MTISSGDRSVTLTVNGSTDAVLFQLPVFVDNLAASTTREKSRPVPNFGLVLLCYQGLTVSPSA